ncbi:MAG: hypothetical protein QMD09_04190 [Desulfatibacillaceae bacterium]|nr:hypothetical protein [Desulfatibacillaceae bacterium]
MQRFYDELVWMLMGISLLILLAAASFVRADEPVLEWEAAVICDKSKAPGFQTDGVELGDIISFREADTTPWGRQQKEIFCFYRMKATRSQMQALIAPVEIVKGEQDAFDLEGNPVKEPIIERVKERRYGLAISTVVPKKALDISGGVESLLAPGLFDKAPGGVYENSD